MNQPEQDQVVNALGSLGSASFAKLPAAVKPIGAHTDDRRIIDIIRTWIEPQGARERRSRTARFNRGVESNHAGEPDDAMLAYRHALSPRPDSAAAAINIGLLPRQAGDLRTAIGCRNEAPRKDGTRLGLANQRARPLEQPGEPAEVLAA